MNKLWNDLKPSQCWNIYVEKVQKVEVGWHLSIMLKWVAFQYTLTSSLSLHSEPWNPISCSAPWQGPSFMTDLSLFFALIYSYKQGCHSNNSVLWHMNENDFFRSSPCLLLWVICHFLYGPVEENWPMGCVMKAPCSVFSKTLGNFDWFSFCRILRRCPSELGQTACCYPWCLSWWHQIKGLLYYWEEKQSNILAARDLWDHLVNIPI